MTSIPLPFDPHENAFMQALCAAALEAGSRIMQHYKDGVEVEEKSDKSPVTQADRDAEDIIERALAALAPDIQMIGEEACSEHLPDKLAPHFFLVDPLDGTRDFVAKRKDFTVNIGLISGTTPVAEYHGVVGEAAPWCQLKNATVAGDAHEYYTLECSHPIREAGECAGDLRGL